MNDPDIFLVDQRQKFLFICEHFPNMAKKLANSINKTIPELRILIWERVYYIDESCELIESPMHKACYEFRKAVTDAIGEDKLNKLDKILSVHLW